MEKHAEKSKTANQGATATNAAETVVAENVEKMKTNPEADEVEILSNAAVSHKNIPDAAAADILSNAVVSHNPVLTETGGQVDELKPPRSDTIGKTLYSERFVVSTLLGLTAVKKEYSLEESFENDLCLLWDITIEEDVVKLLLENDVYDLFVQVISITDDDRLIEILLGIFVNMCNFECAREKLLEEHAVVMFLLQLSGCSDALALLQLMRLFSVMLVYADSDASLKWYQNICLYPKFIDNISFTLSESVNEDLLRQTMETLNAVLVKFALIDSAQINLRELSVDKRLIRATIEALTALLEDEDSSCLSSEANKNFVRAFLNINCILSQYKPLTESFDRSKVEMMKAIFIILQPFCKVDDVSKFGKNEHDILKGVNDLLLALNDPYHETCFTTMLKIWNSLEKQKEQRAQIEAKEIEFEEKEQHKEFNLDSNYQSLLNSIVRMINGVSKTQVVGIVEVNVSEEMVKLTNTLSDYDNNKDMKESHERIITAIREIEESRERV